MEVLFQEGLRRFNKIYREMDKFYHKAAVDCGLSYSSFWILYAICENGEGCLQKEICEMFLVSKQTIHSAIRRLESDGYLYLKIGKGRDKHIYLTEKGMELVERKIAPMIALENQTFEEMGEESKKMLGATEKYLKILKENYKEKNLE